MTRVVEVLAALPWVTGIVVLVVGLLDLPPGIEGAYFTDDVGAAASQTAPSTGNCSLELVIGTVLVGVAGLMTAGLVLVGRRR